MDFFSFPRDSEGPKQSLTFDYQSIDGVDVPSTWRTARARADALTQTLPSSSSVIATQTPSGGGSSHEGGCVEQATNTPAVGESVTAVFDGSLAFVYKTVQCTPELVERFFSTTRIEKLQLIMEKNRGTWRAFDLYSPRQCLGGDSTELLATLIPDTGPYENGLDCLCLAWERTGSLLAAGYGAAATWGWCATRGRARIYDGRMVLHPLRKSSATEAGEEEKNSGVGVGARSKTAEFAAFEFSTSVTALAFHPTRYGLLAVGTFGGELSLVDTGSAADVSNDTNILSEKSGGRTATAATEPITSLLWVEGDTQQKTQGRQELLCCGAQDGSVTVWDISRSAPFLVAKYAAATQRGVPTGVTCACFLVTAASFSERRGVATSLAPARSPIVLGTESGNVFCARDGLLGPAASAGALSLETLEGNPSAITAVDASDAFPRTFLTAGADGIVRVFSLRSRTPLAIFEPILRGAGASRPLFCARFSPRRPGVIAAAGADSALYLIDLTKSASFAAGGGGIDIVEQAGVNGGAILTLAFNPTDAGLVATGGVGGGIRLWRLAAEYAEPNGPERDALRPSRAQQEGTERSILELLLKE